jgi:hypothetical protein
MRRSRLAAALTLALAPALAAADWPMYRGADRTGVSPDTGLLKQWPKGGPPLAWKGTGIGFGYSGVAVMGDAVYTMGYLDDGCYLFALDRAKGGKRWQLKLGPTGNEGYKGTRCTPATDGELVFAFSPAGDLVCAAAADGAKKWAKNLKREFGGEFGGWGYSESPLLDGDRLVVTPGGGKAAVLALDKKTGATAWAGVVPNGGAAGYASVVVAQFDGVKQYVTLMANGLVSFGARDGTLLWRYGTANNRFGGNTANIPTPIVRGEYVFASAGYGRGAALLKVTRDGNAFKTDEVYWKPELTNKHGGVVLVGDRLFGDRDDSGQLWCADFKTGEVAWTRKGGEGRGSASLTAADGRLYVRYSNGWVALVDATADKYAELGAFKVPNGKNDTWAHPVVIGGKLYVRELDTLWVYDVKAK